MGGRASPRPSLLLWNFLPLSIIEYHAPQPSFAAQAPWALEPPYAPTWLNRHGLWSPPTSTFLLPECSPATPCITTPRSHALSPITHGPGSLNAHATHLPRPQWRSSAHRSPPGIPPLAPFPGTLAPAHWALQAIIRGAGPRKPYGTELPSARRRSSPDLFHQKVEPAFHFLFIAPHIPMVRTVSHRAGVFPIDLGRDSLLLFAAPRLYNAAQISWRGFPKPPLSPGFAGARVFPR